jgi:hypothetical protein
VPDATRAPSACNPWLGHTPTGADLERMPLDWFHQAIDQLLRETVPESYWRKVVAKRQAEAWGVR